MYRRFKQQNVCTQTRLGGHHGRSLHDDQRANCGYETAVGIHCRGSRGAQQVFSGSAARRQAPHTLKFDSVPTRLNSVSPLYGSNHPSAQACQAPDARGCTSAPAVRRGRLNARHDRPSDDTRDMTATPTRRCSDSSIECPPNHALTHGLLLALAAAVMPRRHRLAGSPPNSMPPGYSGRRVFSSLSDNDGCESGGTGRRDHRRSVNASWLLIFTHRCMTISISRSRMHHLCHRVAALERRQSRASVPADSTDVGLHLAQRVCWSG